MLNRARSRASDTAGVSEARRQRTNVLSLAEGIRRLASRPGEAAQRTRAGEHAAEESGGRPGDNMILKEVASGKLLSPSRPARVRGWMDPHGAGGRG